MLDEFQDFIASSGLINDGLADRDCSQIFSLALHAHVDALNSLRHLQATLTEFLEMMCRAAAAASFPPPASLGLDGQPMK